MPPPSSLHRSNFKSHTVCGVQSEYIGDEIRRDVRESRIWGMEGLARRLYGLRWHEVVKPNNLGQSEKAQSLVKIGKRRKQHYFVYAMQEYPTSRLTPDVFAAS